MSYQHLAKYYTAKMLAAADAYEEAKRRWADLQYAYATPGRDSVISKLRANGDPRTAEATALAQWHRDEMSAYAAVVTALSTWADDTTDTVRGVAPRTGAVQ